MIAIVRVTYTNGKESHFKVPYKTMFTTARIKAAKKYPNRKVKRVYYVKSWRKPHSRPRHNPEPTRGPLSRIEELKRMRKESLSEMNKILTFEIGPTCRVCNYPIGPDWNITREYIQCLKCKHKYDRSPWSKGT
jgi:hypothetical protein